ncbi:hypothetical protein Q3G72_023116 [Acer saccharum]|nr:hypothetical protein Q3G72_023116 [Acer saccharum]
MECRVASDSSRLSPLGIVDGVEFGELIVNGVGSRVGKSGGSFIKSWDKRIGSWEGKAIDKPSYPPYWLGGGKSDKGVGFDIGQCGGLVDSCNQKGSKSGLMGKGLVGIGLCLVDGDLDGPSIDLFVDIVEKELADLIAGKKDDDKCMALLFSLFSGACLASPVVACLGGLLLVLINRNCS